MRRFARGGRGRLEIHRSLWPKASQNADGFHDPTSGDGSRRGRLVTAPARRSDDNRTGAARDELPPGQPLNHATTLPYWRPKGSL